jgi:hypothetical protein
VDYQGCATVRVDDWGPYTGGRGMELSQRAAEAIGLTAVGVNYVDATALEPSSYWAGLERRVRTTGLGPYTRRPCLYYVLFGEPLGDRYPPGLQTRWRAEHTLALFRSKEMFPRRHYRGLFGKSLTAGVVVEVVGFLRLYPSLRRLGTDHRLRTPPGVNLPITLRHPDHRWLCPRRSRLRPASLPEPHPECSSARSLPAQA